MLPVWGNRMAVTPTRLNATDQHRDGCAGVTMPRSLFGCHIFKEWGRCRGPERVVG